MIQEKLDTIGNQALKDVEQAGSLDSLEKIRVSVLGKKGALSEVLRGMAQVSAEERPKIGKAANEWKRRIEDSILTRRGRLEEAQLRESITTDSTDVTLPPRLSHVGRLHPLTQTTQRIISVLTRIGFDVTTGPEVETEFLNFEAANIPADHPARDMQDTFFAGPGVVLRTHTTPVQMRTMREQPWPVRILCPGAVYRCDSDVTHSPMFHQIEGLWVDEDIKMSHLKGVLEFFAKEIFGVDSRIRLRPSYFPFVEPGAEVDVSCFSCLGKKESCSICKGTGWVEILGAGMVHPELFRTAGYKKIPTGFAFGMGIERIAMLLHRVTDIRLFFQSDLRFLKQF